MQDPSREAAKFEKFRLCLKAVGFKKKSSTYDKNNHYKGTHKIQSLNRPDINE